MDMDGTGEFGNTSGRAATIHSIDIVGEKLETRERVMRMKERLKVQGARKSGSC